ncbi:hypothetical protein [Mangrovibacterium diazotrophicum]|uniref:Uncharacterized protein n=1 Tax=Mangrovibacterium diazotrophicum TaxID=1261403 RepID=A0A419W7N8_9BACT|nr:hypothetical protein [Mangrovibacterium diazotrophicum]RKD91466.1 hypothetical protein BC643_1821 [Mangrovibacterium diazotrophicum]
MDVKNFFQKILSGNKSIQVPAAVKTSFTKQFADPLNLEWHKAAEQFEAVFYKEDLEHIARYKVDGEITCLKVNLPLDGLPEAVSTAAQSHGELMNAISILCDETQKYEVIVRDAELNRYFLLISPNGEVSEKEKL